MLLHCADTYRAGRGGSSGPRRAYPVEKLARGLSRRIGGKEPVCNKAVLSRLFNPVQVRRLPQSEYDLLWQLLTKLPEALPPGRYEQSLSVLRFDPRCSHRGYPGGKIPGGQYTSQDALRRVGKRASKVLCYCCDDHRDDQPGVQ